MTITTKLVLVADTFIAGMPPIFIVSMLFKLLPVMVTKLPIEPLSGLNEVIVGSWANN